MVYLPARRLRLRLGACVLSACLFATIASRAVQAREGEVHTQERVERQQGIDYLAEQFCAGARCATAKEARTDKLDENACSEDARQSIAAALSEDACAARGIDAQALQICGNYLREDFFDITATLERMAMGAEDFAMLERISQACSEDVLCR